MVKIKPYHYLVSFTADESITGNFGLDREHPINDMNDIRNIEKFIETKGNLENVVIINFISLKKGCQMEGETE